MITHLLFQILDKFKVGSLNFRKILAVVIGLMVFALIFTAVKFFKIEIPDFIRNLIMLVAVDLGGFFFLTWKKKDTPENDETQSNSQNLQKNQPDEPLENEQEVFDEQFDEQFDEEPLNEQFEDEAEPEPEPEDIVQSVQQSKESVDIIQDVENGSN